MSCEEFLTYVRRILNKINDYCKSHFFYSNKYCNSALREEGACKAWA